MASETQPSSASHSQPLTQSSSSEPQTSAEIEASLAHLAGLQTQLDALRSGIPSLVKPLKAPTTSTASSDPDRVKAAMFTGVKRAAERNGMALRTLGEEWKGERTQQILDGCRTSEGRDGNLSKAGEVKMWGWEEEEREA